MELVWPKCTLLPSPPYWAYWLEVCGVGCFPIPSYSREIILISIPAANNNCLVYLKAEKMCIYSVMHSKQK